MYGHTHAHTRSQHLDFIQFALVNFLLLRRRHLCPRMRDGMGWDVMA